MQKHKGCRFDPWVGKIPWRRSWQPTPIFLPGRSHGQRSLAGYSPWGHKELDKIEVTEHTPTHATVFPRTAAPFYLSTSNAWGPSVSTLFFFLIVVGFVIHGNESAMIYMCSPSRSPLPPPSPPVLPLGFPSAPGRSACLMHPTWAGDLFHPR